MSNGVVELQEHMPHIVIDLNRIGVEEVHVVPISLLRDYIAGRHELDKNILRCLIEDLLILMEEKVKSE